MREEALSARDARRRLTQELDELSRMLGSTRLAATTATADVMDFKDYYSTLGVAKTATEKEIKQAYRKLARKHHPDVNPGDKAAETRFKEINEALRSARRSRRSARSTTSSAPTGAPYEQAGAGARAAASIRASSAAGT